MTHVTHGSSPTRHHLTTPHRDRQPGSENDCITLCEAGSAIDEYITYEYTPYPPVAVGTAMLARDEHTGHRRYVTLRYMT